MVSENLQKIRATLPVGVTLVAVSKFHPIVALQEAYDAGQRIFGESREQELRQKVTAMPNDVEWHFIGHLQTNKVRQIVPHVALIHSVDSEHLLDEVNRQAARIGKVQDVLLQLHVAQEETKSGFSPAELLDLMSHTLMAERWPNVRLRGVMGMASFVDDEGQWRREFAQLMQTYRQLLDGPLAAQGIDETQFDIRSFGMSEDYPVAISEGSNMVRVGTSIFGHREY